MSVALGLRERFWLRVVSFAVKRANKAGGLHRGMAKYHWTRPAPPEPDIDIDLRGNDAFGI